MADNLPPNHRPDAELTTIRPEVRHYLKACENLLERLEGSHDQFTDASMALQKKKGLYTNEEIALVKDILERVCDGLENGRNNHRGGG
jgi:hypothetical protein